MTHERAEDDVRAATAVPIRSARSRLIALLLPDQGSLYPGMAAGQCQHDPAFRTTVEQMRAYVEIVGSAPQGSPIDVVAPFRAMLAVHGGLPRCYT